MRPLQGPGLAGGAENSRLRMMRLTRAAVAVLSVLLVIGPLTLTARTQETLCPNVVDHGDWQTIAAPAFTQGGAELVDYVVHPYLPTMILATNGEQVMVSLNLGCEWKPYFALELLPDLVNRPVSVLNSKITDLDIPEDPSAGDAVYMVVEESVGPVVRPHVIISKGQDGRFRSTQDGLPAVTGGVYGLHVAPSDPDIVYLHVRRNPTGLEDDIYASTDRGDTWERRNGDDNTASQDMTVDPLMPNDLWTYGVSGLWRSTDGGRTRAPIDIVGPPVPLVDVFHAPGSPARIMAYEAETGTVNISRDGGATWTRISGPPGAARSMAHGNRPDDVVFAQHARVDRFKAPEYWVQLDPGYKQPDLAKLSADRTAAPSVYGMTPRTIERYTGLNNEVELPGFVDIDPTEVLDNSSLKPATTSLKLKPGKSEQVDYRFELPANPKPLDVFFLVDTSDSMDGSISGLRQGMQSIVNELAAAKLNVQFGVGEIKDYPIPGFGDPTQGDFPYRLDKAIGPPGPELEEALESLEASGGGRADYPESQLTGLYQATTGEGEPGCVASPDDERPPCVVEGEGAGFREEALKIIVNITDARFHDEAAHPSPPFATVSQAMVQEGVRQIGLAVYGAQGPEVAYPHLATMAEETEAVAPPGGVDCDGNGSTDIPEGDPLVCQISDVGSDGSLNLAPAIIATVQAIAEDVSVEIITSDKKSVVDVAPALYPSVDITEQNSLGFDLTFTCPRALAGTTHNLTLAANVSGVPAASATAKVVCKAIPAAVLAKRKKPPPAPPVPVTPVFPPSPVVIPVLAPAGPPPVPETISSTQSAAQAQGAVAKQEQKQLQFAMAYAQFKNDEAYALSSYTERSRTSPAPLYLSAVVMSLSAAFIALKGSRVRTSAARRRR